MALVNFIDSTDRAGQLMLAYAGGNEAAFEELYGIFRAPLYRYFLRQCGNRALAEELYQELWMRVIRGRGAYRHKARFSTWLYRIASNLLTDHYRRHGARSDEAEPEILEQISGGENENPAERYRQQERQARLLRELRALPPEQREVFLLKQEGGFSLEDIAQITTQELETVKSRLRYAVDKLRRALADAA